MFNQYFITTVSVVDGDEILKDDYIVNYFKYLKNAKPLVQFSEMMKVIKDPNLLTDLEITDFLLTNSSPSSVINFFKSNELSELKLQIFGFVLRISSSDSFCANVTGACKHVSIIRIRILCCHSFV